MPLVGGGRYESVQGSACSDSETDLEPPPPRAPWRRALAAALLLALPLSALLLPAGAPAAPRLAGGARLSAQEAFDPLARAGGLPEPAGGLSAGAAPEPPAAGATQPGLRAVAAAAPPASVAGSGMQPGLPAEEASVVGLTAGATAAAPGEAEALAAEARTQRCAWGGEDCSSLRCCNQGGMQCFRKNEYHSGCRASCEALDEAGEAWSCESLGGFRDVRELAPAPEGAPTIGTSLFCFAGALPGSAEEGLIGSQRERGQGIFACEDSALYPTDYTGKGEWQSVVNTDVFIRVWERVLADGRYSLHDWAVKVDPDTVFHPQRLRDHLAALRAPAGASVYVKNTRFKFGMQGSLEILSKQALDDYADGSSGCSSNIGHEGGEDFYLVQCLDGIGVAHMLDDSMLDDKYTYDHDYDMGDLSFCGSGVAAAYHPVKDAWAWTECHEMGR